MKPSLRASEQLQVTRRTSLLPYFGETSGNTNLPSHIHRPFCLEVGSTTKREITETEKQKKKQKNRNHLSSLLGVGVWDLEPTASGSGWWSRVPSRGTPVGRPSPCEEDTAPPVGCPTRWLPPTHCIFLKHRRGAKQVPGDKTLSLLSLRLPPFFVFLSPFLIAEQSVCRRHHSRDLFALPVCCLFCSFGWTKNGEVLPLSQRFEPLFWPEIRTFFSPRCN